MLFYRNKEIRLFFITNQKVLDKFVSENILATSRKINPFQKTS